MYEIELLLKGKKVRFGYRQSCGKKDLSEITFKAFEKILSKMEKENIFVFKNKIKIDNAYATSKGGFWNEWEYEIIDKRFITPNVRMLIKQKYRLIKNSIPREIRRELNNAVKNGVLGRFKKDGLIPECYYFINYKQDAESAVYNNVQNSLDNIAKILA